MSAAADNARERLEAALWRRGLDHPAVLVVLALADEYATASAGDAIDNLTRAERVTRTRLQAERRAVLAEAIGAQP